ncbi:hypothetical protein EPO33_03845 [Patescibacteria group bacterium]|nr:MAG: hypothetical protein EPO33_03845 [Patescibacteria group bacterium]
MPTPVPCIAFSGAPCTGKTTSITAIKRVFGDAVCCIPEAATFVIGQAGFLPPSSIEENRLYVRAMSHARMALEDMAQTHARSSGAQFIVADRAVLDAAPYLPGGRDELAELLETTVQELFQRYATVLFFEPPTKEIFDAGRAANPARSDTYEGIQRLTEQTRAAWTGHPSFQKIPATAIWNDKYALVESIIRDNLNKKEAGPA